MLSSYLNYGIILALASLPMSATAATPASQLVRQVEQVTTQLPRGILPSLYDVAVTPHAQSLTFDGEVPQDKMSPRQDLPRPGKIAKKYTQIYEILYIYIYESKRLKK